MRIKFVPIITYPLYRACRFIFFGKIPNHHIYKDAVQGGVCLEIAGMSGVFSRFSDIELYKHIHCLDLLNINKNTGKSINYTTDTLPERHKKMVRNFIYNDATTLNKISNNEYDTVMSSNVLEHIANPIKALKEWQRVLKPSGHIITVVPNKNFCFDRNRDDTSYEHMLADYLENVNENDNTHMEEILLKHDINLNPADYYDFEHKIKNNAEYRIMHHHVFNERTLCSVHEYAGLKVIDIQACRGIFVILAKKVS